MVHQLFKINRNAKCSNFSQNEHDKVSYLAFENSVMFQTFQYFIKGIIITLCTVIVLTNSQLLTCNSINLCNI